MNFLTRAIVRHGPFFIAFLIGYAIGGVFIAVLLSASTSFIQSIFKLKNLRSALSPGATDLDKKQAVAAKPDSLKLYELKFRIPSTASPAKFFLSAWCIIALLPFLCSLILASGHDSRMVIDWFDAWQPAINWLSAYIPALEETPRTLSTTGFLEWGPAQQITYFVGWTTTLPLMIWMVLDAFIFHRTFWFDMIADSRRDALKFGAACCLLCVGILLMLFVGVNGASWRGKYVGIGLVGFGFMFFGQIFFFIGVLSAFTRLSLPWLSEALA